MKNKMPVLFAGEIRRHLEKAIVRKMGHRARGHIEKALEIVDRIENYHKYTVEVAPPKNLIERLTPKAPAPDQRTIDAIDAAYGVGKSADGTEVIEVSELMEKPEIISAPAPEVWTPEVGDTVRTDIPDNYSPLITGPMVNLSGMVGTVDEYLPKGSHGKGSARVHGFYWPREALTLVKRVENPKSGADIPFIDHEDEEDGEE